jgi:hypothetical protein
MLVPGIAEARTVEGTRRGDRLYGTERHDDIYGRRGDDRIYPGRGWDYVDCGSGYDVVIDNDRGPDRFVNCERVVWRWDHSGDWDGRGGRY